MFKDKNLQKLKPKFEILKKEYLKKLDDCSSDIRTLEKELQEISFPCTWVTDEFELSYDKSIKRLVYKDPETSWRPLIETKSEIRLKVWPLLGQFTDMLLHAMQDEIIWK